MAYPTEMLKKLLADGYTVTQAKAIIAGTEVKYMRSADSASEIESRSPFTIKEHGKGFI